MINANAIAEKVLYNLDAFIDSEEVSKENEFSSIIDDAPFKSKKLKARLVNRALRLPLRIMKKATASYLLHQESSNAYYQSEIAELKAEVEALRKVVADTQRRR